MNRYYTPVLLNPAACVGECSRRYSEGMRLAAVALVFATALAAQRGMGGSGGFRGGGGGFRPGMPGASGYRPPAAPGHGGWGWHGGYRPGPGFRTPPFFGRATYPAYGYASSWGWGGGYYAPFGWYGLPWWGTASAAYSPAEYYPYSSSPSVTVVVVPATSVPAYAPDPEPVRATPRVQVRPAPEPQRPLATDSWAYLIAAKDGTIWLARDYSVSDGVVEFSVDAKARKRLPIAEVDQVLTEELNREQGVAVRLR